VFTSVAGAVGAVEAALDKIDGQKSLSGISKLPERWQKIIDTDGDYI
jgi:hypothetical protein